MENKLQSDLQGQRDQRIRKVDELVSLGINPYPSNGNRTHTNNEVIDSYNTLEGNEVRVMGRIMTWRKHGELEFMDLQDDTGKIQLYIKISDVADTDAREGNIGPDHFKLLDIGDHIEATGVVTKTNAGQESVLVSSIRLLSKSLRPLPNKWTGIVDKEARFRRRYLDMTMNPDIRERFKRRAEFWQAVRDFLNERGFYEVNIPVLEHTTGGADARPFVTHYDALGEDFYLRISHELPLKRLLGGGFEKVYDLGPRFRNEGFSDEHLPEHIAMEWYWAYSDYEQGMELTEELFKYVLKRVYGTLQFNVRGFEVDLEKPWERVDFCEIIKQRFGVDVLNDPVEKLVDALRRNSDDEIENTKNRSRVADALWKLIRPTIGGPIFLVGVPKYLSPLAKANTSNPEITDRFHPIIAGSELANAFSELNDPQDQLARFLEQQQLRDEGDDEAQMLDIDFVEMLEYGMPPAVGFGMSERVFWIFEDVSAREGVPFPPLRRGYENSTLKVYEDIIDTKHPKKTEKQIRQLPSDTKLVMVLNKELSGWKLTNTIGHLSAYLGGKASEGLFSREYFNIAKEGKINANCQFPIISFSASNTQLYNLYEKIKEDDRFEILYFIEDMVDCLTDDDVQREVIDKDLQELNPFGIGIMGSAKEVDSLTKKFSLWK